MDALGIGSTLLCFVGSFLLVGFVFLASAIRIVPEYKRLRVYRLGRDVGEKGPGLVLLIPVIDRAMTVDLNSPTVNDAYSLVGAVGETQSAVHVDGSVMLGGRSWDARSAHPIAPRSKVRVRRVVLEVEETTSTNSNTI